MTGSLLAKYLNKNIVFQYTFKMPNEDKIHTVMWDYNIGLVRTTSLFKCNHYSKASLSSGSIGVMK